MPYEPAYTTTYAKEPNFKNFGVLMNIEQAQEKIRDIPPNQFKKDDHGIIENILWHYAKHYRAPSTKNEMIIVKINLMFGMMSLDAQFWLITECSSVKDVLEELSPKLELMLV